MGSDPTTSRLNLNQNWPNWIANRWVDFVTPMAYTNDDARFADLVMQEKDGADNRTILAPGIGFFQQKDPRQMDPADRYHAKTRCLRADALRRFIFQGPSAIRANSRSISRERIASVPRSR